MVREIAIVNDSTLIEDADIIKYIAAAQKDLDDTFSAHWVGCGAALGFVGSQGGWRTPKGMSAILFLDDGDQANILGYHDKGPNGEPVGYVFVRRDLMYGSSVPVTFTHELKELLVDPAGNTLCTMADGRHYIKEVCDAVEADELATKIDGVLISAHVLPAWFEPGSTGPWDSRGVLKGPCPDIAPGGYISYTDGSVWHQITARSTAAGRVMARAHPGSRRSRRVQNPKELEYSVRQV